MQFCEPLAISRLPATLVVAERSFPYDSGFRWSLPCAAGVGDHGGMARAAHLSRLDHWIVPAEEHDGVAATFGLYWPDDPFARAERLALLNWFCVDPRFQGRGLGRRLWNETVATATRMGAQRLVFYSSDEPEHRSADRLYVAGGCARRVGPQLRDGEDHVTFFDLALGDAKPADAALRTEIDALLLRYYAIDGDPELLARAPAIAHGHSLPAAA